MCVRFVLGEMQIILYIYLKIETIKIMYIQCDKINTVKNGRCITIYFIIHTVIQLIRHNRHIDTNCCKIHYNRSEKFSNIIITTPRSNVVQLAIIIYCM